jgi:uncharacterized protein
MIPLAIERNEPASAPPTTPQLSAEVFVIPVEDGDGQSAAGRFIVYAPLRRAAFVGNARVVNLLADLKEGRFDDADDPDGTLLEFLRRLEIVDGGPELRPITEFHGQPEPTSLTLFLTTACNLRCTYCYASAGDAPARNMTLDVATRAIDYVIANAARKGRPRIDITYHGGGEPTVNWRVMTGSFDYARERAAAHGLRAFAATATNGVLDDAQVDWVVANLSGASVSFDGLPEAHDRHRLTIAGCGSSGRVMETLRRFDAANFPYGVRVTVTADQIPLLADSVAYICERFRPRRIQVEPAYQIGRWRDAPSAETTAFVEAFRAARDRAKASAGVEIFYSAARVGTLTNHFCGVTQDTFAVSPDGNV